MSLAVFIGALLMALCKAFPDSVLGVMLAFAGMELALVCRGFNEPHRRLFNVAYLCDLYWTEQYRARICDWAGGMAWCLRFGLVRVQELRA